MCLKCLNGGSGHLASRLVKQGWPPPRFREDDLCDNLNNIFSVFTIYIFIMHNMYISIRDRRKYSLRRSDFST